MNVLNKGSRAVGLLSPKTVARRSRYRILGLVGQGQYGQVFCGVDRKTGELVALKALSQHRASTSEFLQEMRVLLTLQHPNIVACRALEHHETGRYLVMDYCEGGTLRDLLEQPDGLKLGDALQLLRGILAGLGYAHQKAVLHCDLKPENILLMLSASGWLPRLSDFGIARHLPGDNGGQLHQELPQSAIAAIGPPAYSAPERFYGLYSPVSDLYSVGILLFELLLGYRPFSGTPAKMMWLHLNQRVDIPPSVPEPLRSLLNTALEKLPARRFTNAAQMDRALQEAMATPKIRQLQAQKLPLQGSVAGVTSLRRRDVAPKLNRNLSRLMDFDIDVSNPIAALVATNNRLYMASGKNIQGWLAPHESILEMDLPEWIQELQLWPRGGLALARRALYWFSEECWQAQILLEFERDFKVAFDSEGRCLAIATAGELRFYSLAEIRQATVDKRVPAIQRTVPLSTPILPDLVSLDSRHLLATWVNAKTRQTHLQFYNRRGLAIGTLTFPGCFRQLTPTVELDTLVGIEVSPKLSAVQICLRPFQIQRVVLDCLPVCCAIAPWGSAFADNRGHIALLNRQGQLFSQIVGPPAPTAIAAWGASNLAIASQSAGQPQLQQLDIQPVLDAARRSEAFNNIESNS